MVKKMLNIPDDLDAIILQFIETSKSGYCRQYKKGQMLLWQGDRIDHIFAIKSGAVKIFSTSSDGRIYTYGIKGKGGLIGAPELLAGESTRVMVEAIEDTDVIVVSSNDFLHLLSTQSGFSLTLTKKLAKDLIHISDKAKSHSFFDVLQRLKHSLIDLAVDYGIKTDKGICIRLDITHKDIGELIAANRTTITYFINELKRQGYLLKDGKHLVIVPSDMSINETDTAAINREEAISLRN
jgi:CRP-like cAMP-binding protein